MTSRSTLKETTKWLEAQKALEDENDATIEGIGEDEVIEEEEGEESQDETSISTFDLDFGQLEQEIAEAIEGEEEGAV